MTKEEAIAKAHISLQVTQQPIESTDREDKFSPFSDSTRKNLIRGDSSDITITSLTFSGRPYEENFLTIKMYFPQSNFWQYYSDYDKKYRENIILYFYQNKLYAVCITWASSDLIAITQRNFGNYVAVIQEINPMNPTGKSVEGFSSDYPKNWYIWKLNDRLIYLSDKGRSMYIINCKDGFIAERDRETLRKRQEEDAKRKSTADGVKF
ncbi:MAG: hypothetical protein LBU25_03730 [Treponema sp.]|jgi:hypothetical protein|nr:hypothetical protein [Treponema sp.]